MTFVLSLPLTFQAALAPVTDPANAKTANVLRAKKVSLIFWKIDWGGSNPKVKVFEKKRGRCKSSDLTQDLQYKPK